MGHMALHIRVLLDGDYDDGSYHGITYHGIIRWRLAESYW